MREIKFRAWDISKSRFYKVDTISFNEQGDVEAIWTNGPDFARVSSGNRHGINSEYGNLDDVVLLQYAEVRDILGIELYEGDIISHTDHHINSKTVGPIYRKSGSLVFDVVVDEYVYTAPLFTLFQTSTNRYNDTVEYLGNIYENPELISF